MHPHRALRYPEIGDRVEVFLVVFIVLMTIAVVSVSKIRARRSVVYATIEPDIWTRIQEIAKKEGISETVLVRRLLAEALSSSLE